MEETFWTLGNIAPHPPKTCNSSDSACCSLMTIRSLSLCGAHTQRVPLAVAYATDSTHAYLQRAGCIAI